MLQKIQRIAIPEGGRARGFTAGKIETALQGGGSCLWVPESAVQTGRLYARQNGVHKLSGDYYGAGEVVVNVNGYASNGDRMIYPGPGGRLVEDNALPVKIQIDTPPDKLEYEDGEKIDLTGIVVRAYKANGEVWTSRDYPDGVIPVEKLLYEVSQNFGTVYLEGSTHKTQVFFSDGPLSLKMTKDVTSGDAYSKTAGVENLEIYSANKNKTKFIIASLYGDSDLFVYAVANSNDELLRTEVYRKSYGTYGHVSGPYPVYPEEYGPIENQIFPYINNRAERPIVTTAFYGAFVVWLKQDWHGTLKSISADWFDTEKARLAYEIKDIVHRSGDITNFNGSYIVPNDWQSTDFWEAIRDADCNQAHVTLYWPRPMDNHRLEAVFDITVKDPEGGN